MNNERASIKISATDANQRFSRLLAESEQGHDVVITRRGKPVARLQNIHQPKSASDDIGAPVDSDIPDFEARRQLIEYCRKMNDVGLNQGTSGNASARVSGGLLITHPALITSARNPWIL